MRRSLVAVLLGMTLPALWSAAASAHPLAPALLELTQVGPARYAVLWRTSVARVGSARVEPSLPADCAAVAPPDSRIEKGEALVARWVVQCADALDGRTLGVTHLENSGINVIVRLLAQGRPEFQSLLGADQPAITLPAGAAAEAPVLARYLGLGAEHLLTGVDHALFVLGLFLLVPGARRLALTITAFTIGHSLTLACATLGLLPPGQALAELLIAATVLALAVELVRPESAHARSWMRRRPWTMAGAFGLVHGLGFAGALREVGLPAADIPLALLGFNAGIELAQLVLVAALALGARAWRRLPSGPRAAPALPAYLIGTLAACWLLERSVTLLA